MHHIHHMTILTYKPCTYNAIIIYYLPTYSIPIIHTLIQLCLIHYICILSLMLCKHMMNASQALQVSFHRHTYISILHINISQACMVHPTNSCTFSLQFSHAYLFHVRAYSYIYTKVSYKTHMVKKR